MSFAYATICPLVPLFGLAFFCGNWLFWRYQLLYNYQRKYESGGLFFVFLADRILVCAAIMVAFTGDTRCGVGGGGMGRKVEQRQARARSPVAPTYQG